MARFPPGFREIGMFKALATDRAERKGGYGQCPETLWSWSDARRTTDRWADLTKVCSIRDLETISRKRFVNC
jgi:hypothetical protein